MDTIDSWVSRQRAGEMLGGISEDTVSRLIARGLLTAKQVSPRRVAVLAQSVADYLASCQGAKGKKDEGDIQ